MENASTSDQCFQRNDTGLGQDILPWWLECTTTVLLPTSLVTNGLSLLYISYQLKVNRFVSRLLKLDSCFKLASLTVGGIAFFILRHCYVDLLMTCSLTIMGIFGAMSSSYFFQPAIAVVRYHLADRMAKQRLPQYWYLNFVTLLATLANVFLASIFGLYLLYFKAPFGPIIKTCYERNGGDTSTKDPPGGALLTVVCAASLMVGLFYDIRMYRFLKQRKKRVQPGIAMIAWKQEVPAVSLGTNASYKATVPIKATCLGAINLLIIMPVLFTLVKGFELTSASPFILRIIALIIVNVHLPLILLLTVKTNSKKVTPQLVQPPAELQFHEQPDQDLEG